MMEAFLFFFSFFSGNSFSHCSMTPHACLPEPHPAMLYIAIFLFFYTFPNNATACYNIKSHIQMGINKNICIFKRSILVSYTYELTNFYMRFDIHSLSYVSRWLSHISFLYAACINLFRGYPFWCRYFPEACATTQCAANFISDATFQNVYS